MRLDSDEKLPLMDLTGVTRPGVVTSITLDGYPRSEWIRCGVVVLQQQSRGPWRLGARAKEGVTDFEHDSAWIFQLPLVGVSLDMIDMGTVFVTGYIAGDMGDFRVPAAGDYNPAQHPEASLCRGEHCGMGAHPIVPEDLWAGPPADEKFWRKLVGRKLDIRIWVARGE